MAAAHLLVNGIGAASVTAIDGATYVFSFVQPAYGNVAITWNAGHNIYDQALPPNRFNATGPGATWSYTLVDRTAPTVAALSPTAGATVRSLNSITVLFSEPVVGVNAADLLINNIAAAGVTPVAASQYIFTFPEPPTGTVQVAWASGHNIMDTASPANAFTGGSWTYRLDPNAADASPYISEFMASNTRTLADEGGFYEDWIEIYNPSALTVNLDGWELRDSNNQWRFPATNLTSGAFLVVFASGNDRRIPGARLHTSFQLSAAGEYLALVRPDGTIASEFAPAQQVPDVSYGFSQSGSPPEYTTSTDGLYFTTPTPGAANLGGAAVPGPIIDSVQHTPNVPLDHQDLLVTARVRPSLRAIGSVTMRYRIMFSNEVTVPMFDDGAHGDGPPGDNVYGAAIPANLSTNGQMIRYLIAATDVSANASRWPLFTSPTGTEQYLGTIVDPTNVTSKLPIFHLFVDSGQMGGIDSESGGRLSFFYDGEFYDNIYMELRGNTSAGLAKKAHRLEFNRGHELRHAGPGPRTRKSSLLGEYLDPAYLRQHLCFWFLNNIGVPAPYDYPVRVQMNGQFYQLAFHNDVIGQEQMERMGYDPKGALYKAVGNLVPSFASTGVFQKLEPDNDPSRTDYLQLANGINEASSATVRRNTVFDLLDVPQVINHLSGARWCAENDDVWANMSIYRDTFGDGLWRCIPFDMNASWGQLYGGSSPLEATVDGSKSHPLYGGSSTGGNYNRLYDVIVTLPETRQMLLRRERSIMDQMVQPLNTPPESFILENYIKQMTNLIYVEANLDRAKWGFSPWASGKTFDAGVGDLLVQYVGPRRQHWYVTHCITNTSRPIGIANANNAGIPLSQPLNVSIRVVSVDFNPVGGNQEQEYICITNPVPFAVDISGWKLSGAVDFTFQPGTVLPTNSVAYVSPNTRAFRARTTGPRGGQGLFVLGPYKGQLSARGETIVVKNAFGQTVGSYSYPGTPSLAQQFLRITEIMYHPSALAGNPTLPDEYEYIELKNISTNVTLNLAGVRLINGVDFNFTGSAVTTLAPGARVLVVKNSTAFAARYGGGLPVAGQFTGNLANEGERIQLLDATNDEILDFDYEDDWYPITDGLGFSLVIVNENAEPDAWDSKTNWRASGQQNGSPGINDPAPPAFAPVVITEALSRTDVPPPTDSIELHNPTAQAANIGGWWLSDDFNFPQKYRFTNGTVIPPGGYLVLDESQFNTGFVPFALSSDGDEVWLFSDNGSGNLTGYAHGHHFGAADDGVSFGRHVTSIGEEHFVSQISRTLGATNSGPRVGPIVINEIMYRPPDIGTNDNSQDEFFELLNISAAPVQLFDGTNGWKITGGVDFVFPTNLTLAAGEYILMLNFDPSDSAMLAAFRARYGVGGGVRVFGPYDGKLDNSGEDIELKKPTAIVGGSVPYVLIDKVSYGDSAPWPAGADGYGLSLQRRNSGQYGNDPINWKAAPATAGSATASGGTAPVISVHPQGGTVIAGTNVVLSVTASGTTPLRYQWRRNGANILNGTNSLLQLPGMLPEQAGDYNVLVFNNAGSAVSSNATLAVLLAASIVQQPLSVNTNPGANVSFRVSAYSASPLRYQWRKDGVDLLNQTNEIINLFNVQSEDTGVYTVVITDDMGSTISAPAVLNVMVLPLIVTSPSSQLVVPGSTVTFSVTVTNGATLPIGYRWRTNRIFMPNGFFVVNSRTAFITFTNLRPNLTNISVVATNVAQPGGRLSGEGIITYVTDSDGDGIPDWWEIAYGFDTNSTNEATLDFDHDKMSNRAEYIAGTDPKDPQSYLRVESLSATLSTTTISFLAVSNRTYTIECSDDIEANLWQRFADVGAHPTNRVATLVDTNATSARFYRLATPRQP